MAWDDEPPPTESWDATPPKPEELNEGMTWKKTGQDALSNLQGVKNMVDMTNPANVLLHPIDTAKKNVDFALNLPKNIINEGKRVGIGTTLTEGPVAGFKQFKGAFADKPITTTMDLLAARGLMKGAAGLGSSAAEKAPLAEAAPMAAPLAEDLSRVKPGAPPPINLAPEAAEAIKSTPPPAAPPPVEAPPAGPFDKFKSAVKGNIPPAVKGPLDEVRDFIEQKYGQAAAQPGFKDILGDAMIRKAQGMRFRELGGTPGQARAIVKHIGEDGLRELTDVAKETEITKSPIGFQRRQANLDLQNSSGQAIGAIRKIAADRGAIHNPDMVVKAIRSELDPEYLGKGTSSSQKGAYLKALEDIRANATTPESLAKRITKMNADAVKNKMTQPSGAITDVANHASRINNDLIKTTLSPEETAFYDKSLRNFGASKIFEKLQSFEVGREVGGRAGVGGMWRNIKQGAMDMGGSKVMENFYDKFGPRIKSTPGITNNLASLGEGAMSDLLSSLDDAIHDIAEK